LWELDVQLTADEELVLMHDSDLTRTCDAKARFPDRRPWLVSDFTLAEIQTLDCGSWFNEKDPFGQIKAGAVPPEDQQSYVGERAPSLREALQFTLDNDWRVNVEIKNLPTKPISPRPWPASWGRNSTIPNCIANYHIEEAGHDREDVHSCQRC